MGISDAKKFVGKKCEVHWRDRQGQEKILVSVIHDVTFVPLYGGYVITDMDDIQLDQVVGMQLYQAVELPIAA